MKAIRPIKPAKLALLALTAFIVAGLFWAWATHPTQAAPWAPTLQGWAKRKQLTLTNNSGNSLAANTTVAVSVDTQALADAGLVQADCDDLRVFYQPNNTTAVELSRYPVTARSATDCSDSKATNVNFLLQATLSDGSSSSDYYLYYGNPQASAPSNPDNAYDIGSKDALLVCSFNGTTTCAAGETPSTESGAIRYSGGKSALEFDGVDDYISVTDSSSISFTSNLSFSAWVYPTVSVASKAIIVKDQEYRLVTDASGNPLCQIHNGTSWQTAATSSTALTTNSWQYVACTYDGSTLKVFVGGAQTGSQSLSSVGNDTANALWIGDDSTGSYGNFIGRLDEVRISDTVRYTSNFTPSTTPFVRDDNTVLLYHFDENGDDPRNSGKAIDDSGNGNDGTITGAKYVSGLVGTDGSSSPSTGKVSMQPYASHSGIFIEEGTTNLITNPSFDHTTFDTNWSTADGTMNYDSSADTFTGGMDKRNSSDAPFAAGVMVQGDTDRTSQRDYITYSNGNIISGNFYENLDSDQGTVSMWVTPEFDGTDSRYTNGMVLWMGNYGAGNDNDIFLRIYQGKLVFDYGNKSGASYINGPSITGWVAGTTYHVVLSWDFDNTIDGTNYVRFSVDDSHTYAGTAMGGTPSPWTSSGVGTAPFSWYYTFSGLIEGLTIYRRPLYDGTYGIDVGNGDEIASIYNSGSGQDPTLITGSWDVVFDLPTNASTGALSTGTGEAWSHPHSSNLLGGTNGKNGFMMDGTYTNDGWSDEGTPTSVSALATSEKIFAGGYKTVSDAANEGIYQDITVSAGDDWVVRALANSDGTSVPKIILYDQTNGAEIGSLTGTTTSTRTAPDVFIFTGEAPTGSTTLRVKLINTASTGTTYWHQVEVLSNLVDNPSFETGSGDPWIPTGWTNGGLEAGDTTQSSSAHSGNYAIDFNANAADDTLTQNTNPSSNYSAWGAWSKNGSGAVGFGSNNQKDFIQQYRAPAAGGSTNPFILENSSSNWTQGFGVLRKDRGTGGLLFRRSGAGLQGIWDDIYIVTLDDVSLTVTPASEANSTESTGLRVDGTDTLTQSISNLTANSGTIKFKVTPRHSFADAAKFGNANPVLAEFYGDSNDYIKILYQDSSTLRVEAQFNGTSVNADYASPTLDAGTTYTLKISYANGGNLTLDVDGTEKATASGVAAFSTTPATAYFGSDNSGANQYDLTIAAGSVTFSASENTTAPYYKFGSKSAKLDGSSDPGNYVISINPGNTNTHTLSAYVYDGTSGNVGGTVSATVAKLVWEGNGIEPDSYTDMGGGWWRLVYSAATTNSANDYGVVAVDGKTIYVDGVQLEEKGYATTYADGTLGTGYSWSGTAHDSTSSRTKVDLQVLSSGNIDTSAGTVSLWIKPNDDWRQGPQFRSILDVYNNGTGNSPYHAYVDSVLDKIYVQHYGAFGQGGSMITYEYAISSSLKGKWLNLVASWDNATDTFAFYVNNTAGSFTSGTWTDITGDINTNLYVGQSRSKGEQLNSTISDLRIYDTALTSAEVADLYYSGLVSHSKGIVVDEFTGNKGQDPIAIWHFDEGYGSTAYDSSPYGNNLTISGASWSSDRGAHRNAPLQFDGTNDYLSRSYDTDFNFGTDSFTITGWFRHPSSISGTDTILARHSSAGYKIYMNSSGYLCFGIDDDSTFDPDDSACSTTSYADSKWHHFESVIARDDSPAAIYMYIDGQLIASDTSLAATGSLNSSNTTLYVGIDTDGSSNPWDGFLDEIKVYPYARTSAQVKSDVLGSQASAQIGGTTSDSLTEGLMGWWKMDDNVSGDAQTITDLSGNGNDGTTHYGANTTGMDCTVAGKYGGGCDFDGSDDYMDTQSSGTNQMDNWSIAAWIKVDNVTPTQTVVMNRYSYALQVRYGNIAYHFPCATAPGLSTSVSISTDIWTHVVLLRENGTLIVYKNGMLGNGNITTTSPSQSACGDFNSVTFGKYNPPSEPYYFNGLIDDVRIYNRALSPREVRELYNYAPGPAVYLKMDDGTGTSAQDSSGNSRTGTLQNNASWKSGKFGKGIHLDGSGDSVDVGDF